MNDRLNNIFSETECLSAEVLMAYAEDKLNAQERYQVEKHLTDCELCSDALEGLSLLKDKTRLPKLMAGINSAISKRVDKKEARVFRFDFRMRLAVAALIIIVLGFTFLFKYVFQEQKKDMMAQRMIKEPDIIKEEKKPLEKNIDSNTYNQHETETVNAAKPGRTITIKDAEKNSKEQIDNNIPVVSEYVTNEPKNEVTGGDQQIDRAGYFGSKGKETDSSKVLLGKADEDKYHANTLSFAQDYKSSAGENLQKAVADSISVTSGYGVETKTTSQSPVVANNSTVVKNTSYAYNKEPEKREEAKDESKFDKKTADMSEEVPTVSGAIATSSPNNSFQADDGRYSAAVQKFYNNDYSGSEVILESYLKDKPDDANALYYCGVSCYNLAQYDKAITYLEKAIKVKQNNYIESAQWYLALSYIGKNENNKADSLLNQIVKANGSFKAKAEQKLMDLK